MVGTTKRNCAWSAHIVILNSCRSLEAYRWGIRLHAVASLVESLSDKINHRHLSAPFASYFAGVMQDKGLPNYIERICTTLLIPPVMSWHDMYSIYIFL